jgi:serine protease Do
MSSRRQTWFYGLLIAVTSAAAALVLASRLGLAPESAAQTPAPPMNSSPLTGPLTSSTFRDIAKTVSPAVVNIRTESRRRTQDLSEFFGDSGLFDRFFGQPDSRERQQPREQVVQSAGTGFIIDKAGLILTNNHVVEGATKIKVSLYGEDDDQEYDARVVGRDALTDSALIELTQKPDHTLPEVKFGDSSQMQPGDWVMAIGNPFGLAHTVSVGVISGNRPSELEVAVGRRVTVIQTDAAINPGNSGGPLLNIRGEVVGINVAIYTDARRQGNIGIGFAIPANSVRELLPQLRVGKVPRGRIGVDVLTIPREAVDELGLKTRGGALIRRVLADSAASRAGLEPGDVIIAFGGKPVQARDELIQMVLNTKPGTTVPLRIVRNREERSLSITVDELDLEAENRTERAARPDADPAPETSSGFGFKMQNVTADIARQLNLQDRRGAVVTDVEPGGPAAGLLATGDLIVRVGGQQVGNRAEAQRELEKVQSGGTAFLRVVRGGEEIFVPVTKE